MGSCQHGVGEEGAGSVRDTGSRGQPVVGGRREHGRQPPARGRPGRLASGAPGAVPSYTTKTNHYTVYTTSTRRPGATASVTHSHTVFTLVGVRASKISALRVAVELWKMLARPIIGRQGTREHRPGLFCGRLSVSLYVDGCI